MVKFIKLKQDLKKKAMKVTRKISCDFIVYQNQSLNHTQNIFLFIKTVQMKMAHFHLYSFIQKILQMNNLGQFSLLLVTSVFQNV